MWQPTRVDLQSETYALHCMHCDVAGGHMEAIKGAEPARTILEDCIVKSLWPFGNGLWSKFV